MKHPPLGFICVKVVALAVTDEHRANEFYAQILGLPPVVDDNEMLGYQLGESLLMLKPAGEWYAKPSNELNPRITLEVESAGDTAQALRARGVTISDPVSDYNGYPVGAFLDSEGNKIWFCSEPE